MTLNKKGYTICGLWRNWNWTRNVLLWSTSSLLCKNMHASHLNKKWTIAILCSVTALWN